MNVLGIGQKRYQGIFNFTIYMKSKIIKSALWALLFLFFCIVVLQNFDTDVIRLFVAKRD